MFLVRRKLVTVHIKGMPICISTDGLNVVDDCGDVDGFVHMLETIYGKDKEESVSMWTGLDWQKVDAGEYALKETVP